MVLYNKLFGRTRRVTSLDFALFVTDVCGNVWEYCLGVSTSEPHAHSCSLVPTRAHSCSLVLSLSLSLSHTHTHTPNISSQRTYAERRFEIDQQTGNLHTVSISYSNTISLTVTRAPPNCTFPTYLQTAHVQSKETVCLRFLTAHVTVP